MRQHRFVIGLVALNVLMLALLAIVTAEGSGRPPGSCSNCVS